MLILATKSLFFPGSECACDRQINRKRGPTYKVELIWKDPEEGLTVQSKHDGEVRAQRAPDKHMVENCPEACVESDLHTDAHEWQRGTVNTL